MEIDPLLYFSEHKSTLEMENEGDIPHFEATGFFLPPILEDFIQEDAEIQ